MSPRSDSPNNSNYQPNGRPPGDDKNDNNNTTICTDGSCADVEEEIEIPGPVVRDAHAMQSSNRGS